ncbi:hypothetical protein MOP88_11405 [Sphingomonas sp. WKB10]|nr:hypothetical protein [Sphingomonas sp. WKB10]
MAVGRGQIHALIDAFHVGIMFELHDPFALRPVDQDIARDREDIAWGVRRQFLPPARQRRLVYVLPDIHDLLGRPPVTTQIAGQRRFQGKHLLAKPPLQLPVVYHRPPETLLRQRVRPS